MKDLRRVLVVIPAAALILFLVAAFMTRDAMQHLPPRRVGGPSGDLVDQSAWTTVVALAPLAVSAEEQGFVRDAARIADHEVNKAFALALRQVGLQNRVLTGEALVEQQKVQALQQAVKTDQAQVAALSAAAQKTGAASTAGDDLDVAKAQLGLDQDELADAAQDLARVSGDKSAQIQQELAAHEAAMKKTGGSLTGDGEIAVIAAKRYATLLGRLEAWDAQRTRAKLIGQAEREAVEAAGRLTAEHGALRTAMQGQTGIDRDKVTGAARVKMLQGMAAQRAIAGLLDDQTDNEQQLGNIYRRWQAQVWTQHRIVDHMLMVSFAWVAAILLGTAIVAWGGHIFLERISTDPRQLHTLQTIFGLGVQLVGLLLVLLAVFGPPSQVPTILGLATAGLTVVFQSFIIAFCGWFVLMGKNGLRVGDWVEIDGVGGEVVEIGVFRTALLETGNWTTRGHPTGRRVTFLNGFAINGQYFNFSTSGQWMWDEITLSLAQASDYAGTIERIRRLVAKETESDVHLAAEEWKSVVRQNSLSQFSAEPTVDVRPAASGIEVVVRYVTRAGNRFDLKNRIYQGMVELLREPVGLETK
jgi:small-conductance mechanosensitive channel